MIIARCNSNKTTVNQLNTQIFVKSIVLLAVVLSIYTTAGFKDILQKGNQSCFTKPQLNKITLYASKLSLFASLYFLYDTYQEYLDEQTTATKNFFDANFLATIAQALNFKTLKNDPNSAFIANLTELP